MDPIRRREKLSVRPSPGTRLDFVVTLEGDIPADAGAALSVVLRYVPDRDVLDPAAFTAYLKDLGAAEWETLEAVGVAVLDDVNNEVVPRWVQVAVYRADTGGVGRERHAVLLEDRQPRWDNPSLLSRLPTL